ncbi:ABC transporter ATP-binding protein, partial [Bacteroidota bacterium]
MSDDVIIRITNLTKYYKGSEEPAIDHLSLDIQRNEIFGLLGPNGAGKTTTISILCGLFPPTEGDVSIDGLDIRSNHEKIKHIIGIVPQEVALYPTLTGLENLQFFGKMYGLRGSVLKDRINNYLVRFGLEKFARKQVSSYSGGMKRRVNMIAGLLHKPKILFLDEPTVGIDVQSRNVILEFLHELREQGTTIIYTSHYMEEAEKLCNRVAIVDQGKLIALGNPGELVNENPEFKNLETMFLHLTGKG